ncbi:enterotoxin A family protein [Bartonella bilalgolemii]|uniref:Enterotoxin A family protein n=1 Tax=Bartonella bilalgolemii TaxID=2942911 RepID=A0ABT0PAA9_9HYPH|nr:enterotoxin A family protein [Bartonella sp. G70]MCL6230162.1 enterotoxin A family protein [Bartonella sp. G70]
MFKLFVSVIIIMLSQPVFADNPIHNVYRATTRSPEEIKRAGGFLSRGMDETRPNQPPANISLWNHMLGNTSGMANDNSGYVSTTINRGIAIDWVNDRLNHNGYVYHIRATPNFVDVNASLGNYSLYYEEEEIAALGLIHWDQIIGWESVREGTVGEFIPNPDYNEQLYMHFTAGGAQPQLAAFPDGHPAWGEQPWVRYARCELKSSCSPEKSPQQFGTDWFWKSHYAILAILITYID